VAGSNWEVQVGRIRVSLISMAVVIGALAGAGVACANPIFLPTVAKQAQKEASIQQADQSLTPPAPPCPESGMLPPPFSNCGLPETPATSLPYMGNMAYWGGHVQTTPKEYLVYWGWGDSGAWPAGDTCTSETIAEPGVTSATLPCDPDGAGKYMADFVSEMGGTGWAGVSTQYYQSDSSGNPQYITNPSNVLAGIWVDDGDGASSLPSTSSSAPAGSGNTYYDLAQEAIRAAQHFGVSGSDLANANFIILQPYNFSDPNAVNTGYCAFHDYTDPNSPGNSYYKGITTELSYTNMPYALAINSNGVNVCGEYAVNNNPSDSNPATSGKLDGFSIVLGHEIEETITDPGAEDVESTGPTGTQTYLGGWYDPFDANENGDKCAWVGENLLTAQGPPEPIYGALGNINGNRGDRFAVQSLWSNAADEGTGYCAGAGTDSPLPSAPYGSSTSSSSSSSSSGNSSGNSSSSSGSPGATGSSGSSASTGSSSSSGTTTSGAKKPKAKKATTHKKRKRRLRRHHKRSTRKHKK
jgi:serine protease